MYPFTAMVKSFFLSLPVGLSVLLGCNSEPDNLQPSDLVLTQEPSLSEASARQTNPMGLDSMDAYRPALGPANTARQFPFGSAAQRPTGPRLTKVSFNGRTIRTFQYDGQGRLSERTDYYTNGVQIYRKFAYTYGPNGPERINSFLNKEAGYIEGFPKQSELRPSATITFAANSDTVAQLKATTVAEFLDGYRRPGTTSSVLGFSPNGALVWEEKTDEQGQLSQYTLYRRNQANNVVLRRSGYAFNRWDSHRFTHDDKPNPFRTTGDLQPLDLGELGGIDMMSANNVLEYRFTSSMGGRETWRYTYDYRPDGYPQKVTVFRSGRQSGTYEFGYN